MEDGIENIFFASLLCGIIFLTAALITYFYPPKKINYLYGYRTAASMRSQERWDFAQRFSSVQMIRIAIVLIVTSPLGYFIPLDANVKFIVDIILIILMVGYLFVATENAIKKRFRNNTQE